MTRPQLDIEQQVILCGRIATLVRARLPLIGSLARTTGELSRRSADAASIVEGQVAQGQSLASALAGDDSRDSHILAACIEAGEKSGALDRILELWAGMHIANTRASKAMRTAMIYPLLLILITLLSLGFVIWRIIPEYRTTYAMFSHELPLWLEIVVQVREHLWFFLVALLLLMLLPLGKWIWRRRSYDEHGIPREPVRRARLQALATDTAAFMLEAEMPLAQVAEMATRTMHAHDSDREQSFERLQQQRQIVPLPRESSTLLASLHVGVVERDEAVRLLHLIGEHLRQRADFEVIRQARWLPMMVAIVVGSLTVLTYVFLIYLPWIVLLTKIVEVEAPVQ